MQQPIPLGTVLQNRYRLIKILGKGGFGRTYLAEDQGRFNELCALKELIPAQTGKYVLEKSKELFQREAAILYQIQHPQVPQFRATFEQDQRLFLVQDYVEGKTYRTMLDERKAAGQRFSEAEVLQLMRQLLPVLAHLHSRGIIHRDISPDNIILQERDAKPVLIDFGIVKELATRFKSPNVTHQPTTVGKLGYAPSEQIQTGRAYPSSDLYALAVTAVVLLSGREPQELFDDIQALWYWQRWVKVSPEVGRVLNRMLSYKPNDRYQSVAEVAKALPVLNHQPNPQLPSLNYRPPAPALSQIQTIAVGHRPDLIQPSSSKPNQPAPMIPAPTNREIRDNPWAIAVIGTGVAIFTGIGSWALVSYILTNQQRPIAPQTFPSPLFSETPTPTPVPFDTPTPTPSTEPINSSQRLNVTTGEATGVEGSLKVNETINYIFSGEQGQQLSVNLAEEGVLLTVLGPNQEPIDEGAQRVTRYEGTLPNTGEYAIVLSPVQGVAESNYQLNLRLENPLRQTPTPQEADGTPSPQQADGTPSPQEATPTVDVESINFKPGETATQVSGQVRPHQIKHYRFNFQEGQLLFVAVIQGAVTLIIRYPDGRLVEDAFNVRNWQGQVPSGGDYQIDVIAIHEQVTDFSLDVSVLKLE